MSDEYTYVVLHGSWAKYTQNGDWHKFEIDVPGKNYPVKADTKRKETIDAMMALRDQPATFTIAEKPSQNINPQSGQPYTDRYVSKVEAGHVGEGAAAPAVTATPSSGKPSEPDVDWDEKERRKIRSLAWAHTNAMLGPVGSLAEQEMLQMLSLRKLAVEVIYVDICRSHEFAHPNLGADVPFGEEPSVPFD